jgi:hypothetical protein
MADGQADNSAPESLDDLAAFLVDNPMETGDRPPRKQGTDQGTAKPASKPTVQPQGDDKGADDAHHAPEPDDAEESPPEDDADEPSPEDEEEDDAEGDAKDRTSDGKKLYSVTVKGENGEDEQRKMTLDDLKKGVMLQHDYSRKRAADEQQKGEFAQRGIAALEGQRQRHIQQLNTNLRALQQIAGIRNSEEMLQLSQSDPNLYAQEQARQQVIYNFFGQTQQLIDAEIAESKRQQASLYQQEMAHAWGVLGNQGIDKPKLRKMFDDAKANYGFADEQFENVTDPRLVLMMRDANAYRDLKAKTAKVTKQAKDAPPLPKQRQATPRNERLVKAVDGRFKGGKATMNDLAAYIHLHKL